VPGGTQVPSRKSFHFHLRDSYPLWLAFPHHSANRTFSNFLSAGPYNPQPGMLPGGFGLFPVRSPLLGEWSLFLWVLRCFSSPGSLLLGLCVQQSRYRWFATVGFPIRISPDQRLYTASRGLSQCPTSFFGIWRQGIHHKLLVASPRDAENSISLLLTIFFVCFALYSVFKVQAIASIVSVDCRPLSLIDAPHSYAALHILMNGPDRTLQPVQRSLLCPFYAQRPGSPPGRPFRSPAVLAFVSVISTRCILPSSLALMFLPCSEWR
jgi:hypothetical protein